MLIIFRSGFWVRAKKEELRMRGLSGR